MARRRFLAQLAAWPLAALLPASAVSAIRAAPLKIMSAKPGLGGSIITLGGAAFLGFAAGLAASARGRKTFSVVTDSADS